MARGKCFSAILQKVGTSSVRQVGEDIGRVVTGCKAPGWPQQKQEPKSRRRWSGTEQPACRRSTAGPAAAWKRRLHQHEQQPRGKGLVSGGAAMAGKTGIVSTPGPCHQWLRGSSGSFSETAVPAPAAACWEYGVVAQSQLKAVPHTVAKHALWHCVTACKSPRDMSVRENLSEAQVLQLCVWAFKLGNLVFNIKVTFVCTSQNSGKFKISNLFMTVLKETLISCRSKSFWIFPRKRKTKDKIHRLN